MPAPKSPYRWEPEFEAWVAFLCCFSPAYWHAVGHAIDPARLERADAQRVLRAARFVTATLGAAPSIDSVWEAITLDPQTSHVLRRASYRMIVALEDYPLHVEAVTKMTHGLLRTKIEELLADINHYCR